MPDSCCASGCTNFRGDNPGLCFYRILSDKKNIERTRLWIGAIKCKATSVSREGIQWQPNIHVFAANTSSKLSTSKVKHKYINYCIFSHNTHLYVIGLTVLSIEATNCSGRSEIKLAK